MSADAEDAGGSGEPEASAEPVVSPSLPPDEAREAEPKPAASPSADRPEARVLSMRVRFALAFASGLLYWLAFPGVDAWPFTFIALAPLLVALRGLDRVTASPAKLAVLLGLTAGTTMNVCGFLWLVKMLKTFSGFPVPLCLVFVVIICSYQGGRIALLGWLYARGERFRVPRSILFALAFAASELLYPLLFPWFYAATVHDVPALTQTAELGGPILVGLVLVCINLGVAEIASSRLDRRPVKRITLGLGFGIPLVAMLFGVTRLHGIDVQAAAAPPLHVGIVQGNMELVQKREDPAEGLRRHVRLTRELKAKGADLVVWSESSFTFPQKEEAAAQNFKNYFAGSLGVPTIFGAVLYRHDADRERWFNVAVSTDARGQMTGRYDKEFLLAFGEYLPFGDTFPILYTWSPMSGHFSSGTSLEPLQVMGADGVVRRVTALICYEDILPSFTNKAVRQGDPELIVNLTNDAWFGDTAEPWEHLALSQMRAIEHRRYFVRATNSGVSAIVDPVGRVIAHSGTFRPEALDATVHWMGGGTVYEVIGDVPVWILALVSVGLAVWPRKKRLVSAS